MPKEITVPRLGWSMEEGTFGEWLKSPGDLVRPGDMVFLLDGDKATHEIESFDTGTLCIPHDAPQPGETVTVGQVIGFLLAEGESAPASVRAVSATSSGNAAATPPETPTSALPASSFPPSVHGPRKRAAGPAARRSARELGIDLNAVLTPDPTGRVLCEDVLRTAEMRTQVASGNRSEARAASTPRARRRAQELGIDWTQLRGTGRGGRIRERDVLAASAASAAIATPVARTERPPVAPGRHQPASSMRRVLAQQMLAGVHQTAPVTLMTKVDASTLVALRERWRATPLGNCLPSYNDLFIKLAAMALRELPEMNACWHCDGIWIFDSINIALAVDTASGLLAPVIHNADQLTLTQIAARSRELTERARSSKLTQSQLEGGTFTVTNLGMLGVDAFTPILNLPQAAILGIGRIVQEPIVRDGRVEVGQTLSLSLTFDHRVLDGAPAARWLQRFSQMILLPDHALNVPSM